MHGNAVDAVADLGVRIGDVLGAQAAIDGLPGSAGVVGAEHAGGGYGDVHATGIGAIEENGVQAQAAGAGLPAVAGAVIAQGGKLLPVAAAIGGVEKGGILDAGVDRVGIGERWLQVPDALEFPGMRSAVVPLMGAGDAVVDELVADRLPGFAAIVGALHQLPEPAAGLGSVKAIGIGGRTLDVVDFPTCEKGAADVPVLALAVRLQNERALMGTNQNPHSAHLTLLPAEAV